jgi:DNA mismatch repair ATPase MutS
MSEQISVLRSDTEKLLTNSLCVSGNKVRMTDGGADTFLNGIIACAKTLGTDIPKVKNPESRELSPDIINGAASLNPELMKKLKEFKSEFLSYYRANIVYYRKELEFYLTMLDFTDRIRQAGIPLTYPTVGEGRIINITEAYDVSLLAKGETNIVPNDISFTTEAPFYFLTGANGGGKTTYLRTVGIAVLMFLLGCPVPCVSATISDISSVFTHFPRDERFDGSGRFVEENNRVNAILDNMDDNSLVLLNETYSTTNEENAVKMTEKLASELWGKRIFGLYITHQHSLSGSEIPYLNVLIDLTDENRRTYKIARQKSVGGSYAKDILIRCGLTFEALENRFGKLDNGEGRE